MSGGAAPATRRTATWIAAAFALLFLVTGGGRIVGSDEVTMAELSRAIAHGRDRRARRKLDEDA